MTFNNSKFNHIKMQETQQIFKLLKFEEKYKLILNLMTAARLLLLNTSEYSLSYFWLVMIQNDSL